MRLTRFMQWSWSICFLLVLTVLGTSEIVGLEAVLLCAALGLWNLKTQFQWKYRSWGVPYWSLVLFWSFLVFVGWRHYSASRDIAYLFGWSILGATVLALRGLRTEKSHWIALLLSGLLSLVALVSSESFLSYLGFLLLAPVLLVLMNASHLYFHALENNGSDMRVPLAYLRTLFGSITAGLALGAAVFVFFPRSLQWQNPLSLRSKDAVTGYSGKLQLGGKDMQLSSSVAVILESANATQLAIEGPNMYLRANSLDFFNGSSWSVGTPGFSGYISARALRQTRAASDDVRSLKLYRELHQTRAILYPGVLRSLSLPYRLQMHLRLDSNRNLERGNEDSIRYTYQLAYSPYAIPQRVLTEPVGRSGGRRAARLEAYFQIPESVRQAQWFEKFVAEIRSVNAGANNTLGAVLTSVQFYFRQNFRAGYKGQTEGTFDLESFLSRSRYGHCEYFATAATLALRAQGIPARVVLGYRGGTFNPISKVLEVRESNAHAWVEYFVPEWGWLPFEPTPLQPAVATAGPWTWFTQAYGAFRFWFERYIVDYNIETQISLLSQVKSRKAGSPHLLSPIPKVYWAYVGVLLAMALAVGGLWWRRRFQRRARTLPEYWRRFEEGSVHLGALPRGTAETFLMFLERVEKLWPPGEARAIYLRLERELYSH